MKATENSLNLNSKILKANSNKCQETWQNNKKYGKKIEP